MRTNAYSAILLATALLSGCGTPPSPEQQAVCADAARHITSCTGSATTVFTDVSCDDDAAMIASDVLEQDCDSLSGAGKADGQLGCALGIGAGGTPLVPYSSIFTVNKLKLG